MPLIRFKMQNSATSNIRIRRSTEKPCGLDPNVSVEGMMNKHNRTKRRHSTIPPSFRGAAGRRCHLCHQITIKSASSFYRRERHMKMYMLLLTQYNRTFLYKRYIFSSYMVCSCLFLQVLKLLIMKRVRSL